MVAVAAILTPFGWLAAPLMKMLFDKALQHLGTGMDERKKILAATVLPRLSLAIEKAEKSHNKEKLVDWLKRLKGAYYEAEEAMDLFEYELLKQKVKDGRKKLEQKEKKKRGTQISLPSQFVPRHLKIASVKLKDSLSIFSSQKIMLKGCINKLIEIVKEANEFRDLLEVNENSSGSDAHRETISVPPGRVFGREKDKENIVSLVTKKPSNSDPEPSTRQAIPIIAITGRSGVGKTALAQYVYKHIDGHEHFDLQVWVHAPRKFNATDVIKNMIEIIKAKESTLSDCKFNSFTSLEALSTQITSMLRPKKLLLVLDDFWADTEDFKDQWEKLITSISSCLSGSKVIITTQYKNAANLASLASATEVETYYLREIEDCHFLELFLHYAWPSNSHLRKEQFQKIGQKIVVKLKGDPGAAKLVGYQLSGQLDLRHWEEVAQKDWLGDNMKARIWSYQQLPLDLQCCFAICSLFPKGTLFPRTFLTKIWMAEGFIRPIDKQERLEDIAENYLDELVSRFFIEELEVEVEKEKLYQLHDLLHDLAEQVQGDDFIRIDSTNSREVSSNKGHMLSRSENIRHIYMTSSMVNELKENLCLMKNICTFYVEFDGHYFPKEVSQEIMRHLKKLRVLQLPSCGDELPDSISNLKHLRLLLIVGSQPLKKLPDSICKLYHLQALYLPDCESLPKDFTELISLRRFATGGETISRVSNVGRLTSLQSLDRFIVRNIEGNELHQLENLNQLRGKLCITGLENVRNTTDAVQANMRNKKHLNELEFEWNSGESKTDNATGLPTQNIHMELEFEWNSGKINTDNATGLSTQHVQLLAELQPHPNTSYLTLNGYGGDRFPNWLLSDNSLKHLTSLTLVKCGKVEEISSINGSLPNFESLILRWLQNLKKMPSLPPNLTYLVIDHIPQLIYCSEDDLLMKEERKKSKQEAVNRIADYQILNFKFWLAVETKMEAAPEISITRSQYENIFSEIVKYNPCIDDYSQFKPYFVLMYYNIKKVFDKNEVSKLVLPPSLTYLKISKCSITSDALSTCIQCLVSLSQLELSNIYTLTFLPSKEVLCSLKNLKSLIIKGCYLLSSLGGIGCLTSLTALELHGCCNLNTSNETLPSSLESLQFFECSNIDVILAKSNLPVLCVLDITDKSFKNWRRVLHVGHLSCLQKLFILGWNGRLEGLNSLTGLSTLKMTDCPHIKPSSPKDQYASTLQEVAVDNLLLLKLILSNETISSIETLVIYYFHENSPCDVVFQSLTSLKNLLFYHCNITHLPKNLKNLASLQNISLGNCPNLCELEELPRNLHALLFKGCPSLTEMFNKDGPYRVRFREERTIVTFLTEEERNRF